MSGRSEESPSRNSLPYTEKTIITSTDAMPTDRIDHNRTRYPHCIVWTPIPCLTWLFPIIGHMGICMTSGVIRDFAGPYHVSEDCMAFGNPTKYLQLDTNMANRGRDGWDKAVFDASECYKGRMHNLCCDNCHSHVAMALNLMQYKGSHSWNMINVTFYMLLRSRYVSLPGFIKTWLPFLTLSSIIIIMLSKCVCGFVKTWLPFIILSSIILVIVLVMELS